MGIIAIIIGFFLGYTLSKTYHPKKLGVKIIFSLGLPIGIFALIFFILGSLDDWNMYLLGGHMVAPFLCCIAMLISLLIFIRIKHSGSEISTIVPAQDNFIEEPITVETKPETFIGDVGDINSTEESPNMLECAPNTDSKSLEVNITNSKQANQKKVILIVSIVFVSIIALSVGFSYYLHLQTENKRRQEILELYKAGKEASDKGLYELAIKYFEDAIIKDSTNWGLHYMVGEQYYVKNKYSTALPYYFRAYSLNTNADDEIINDDTLSYERLLYRYAASLIHTKTDDRTLAIVQEYYNRYSDLSSAYALMTHAYFEQGDVMRALKLAKKMIDKFPNEGDSYFHYAYILAENNQNKLAIETTKNA